MQAFRFKSGKDRDLVGFSTKADGSNLPSEWNPWTLVDPAYPGVTMSPSDSLGGVGPAGPVIDDLERQGFHLTRGPNLEAP